MYYRSDWLELGLSGPLIDGYVSADDEGWQKTGSSRWRWVSRPDDFESRLYGMPVFNLHLEILDFGRGWLTGGLNSARFCQHLPEILQQFLQHTPWPQAYVAAKLVRDEPLYQVLADAGFEPVEHRCLYRSKVDDLLISQDRLDDAIQYRSLADIAEDRREGVREQMLEICNESFRQGHSRHFADHFLLQRTTGLGYILEVMKLNFERVPLHRILLALDTDSECLCGFSILGERFGPEQSHYTQLLSAVRNTYRGKGIYAGLTRLLTEILPHGARLLNVTHAENHAMRRAYQDTGRLHYADTLVLRRVFGSADNVKTDV